MATSGKTHITLLHVILDPLTMNGDITLVKVKVSDPLKTFDSLVIEIHSVTSYRALSSNRSVSALPMKHSPPGINTRVLRARAAAALRCFPSIKPGARWLLSGKIGAAPIDIPVELHVAKLQRSVTGYNRQR